METIVIIGGGFAGLNLVKRLDKDKYKMKLIDRNNFHCFPPLFYQIASCGLASANIILKMLIVLVKKKKVNNTMWQF